MVNGCEPGGTSEVVPGLRARFHRYTSTACRHHPHVRAGRCRRTCKFCGAGCRCYCHTGRRWWRTPVRAVRFHLREAFNRRVSVPL